MDAITYTAHNDNADTGTAGTGVPALFCFFLSADTTGSNGEGTTPP